jgi:hypothetical protein
VPASGRADSLWTHSDETCATGTGPLVLTIGRDFSSCHSVIDKRLTQWHLARRLYSEHACLVFQASCRGLPMKAVEMVSRVVDEWLKHAIAKAETGELTISDLTFLRAMLDVVQSKVRHRLLYLHAKEPAVESEVIGWAINSPPAQAGIAPTCPYGTVARAIADGWRVIHFPQQSSPFDDDWETDILGFEFILEREEFIDD